MPLLMANGIDERNTDVWGYDGSEAQDALGDGRIDAAFKTMTRIAWQIKLARSATNACW